MIIDKLAFINRYKGINENLDIAIDFLLGVDLDKLSNGTIEIKGKEIFLTKNEYVARNLDEGFFEAHKDYIDIHLVLKGIENIYLTNIYDSSLILKEEYNFEKDMIKYENTANDAFKVSLKSNDFAIVFKQDVHMPKIKENNELITKIVVKIKL